MELASILENKPCTLNKVNNMQLIECVRKFQLPKQFPSMASTKNDSNVVTSENNNMLNIPHPSTSTLTIAKSMKVIPDIKYQVPYKLQKLRIVSPNGKDLGEFNVELRSDQSNSLKEKIITITKLGTFKSINKPVKISLPAISKTKRLLPSILKQSTIKIAKYNMSEMISCRTDITNPCKGNMIEQQQSFPAITNLITIDRGIRTKKIQNGNMGEIKTHNMKTPMDVKNSKYFINKDIVDNNEYIKQMHIPFVSTKNKEYLNSNTNVSVNFSKNLPSTVLTKDNISTDKEVLYKKIAKSRFPIVKCKKLDISPFNYSNMQIKYTEKCMKNGDANTSINSILHSIPECNQIKNNLDEENVDKNDKDFNNQLLSENSNSLSQDKLNSNYQDGQICEIKARKNIMTILPNSDTLLSNNHTLNGQGCDVLLPASNKNIINATHNQVIQNGENDNIQTEHLLNETTNLMKTNLDGYTLESSKSVNITNENTQPNIQNKDCFKNLLQKDLTNQWSIITKAVSSVIDEDLRAKALKALADCGIGTERYVPIHPPEEVKTVHDSQIQTTVFGLLDPKCFVLLNDLDNIERIQEVTGHNLSTVKDLLKNKIYPYNNATKMTPDVINVRNDLDIDTFIDQLCGEHINVHRVNKILSAESTKYKNIIKQLQNDFESVKKYDQNGMLNIHKAVISNNIFDVQRHLMVLLQCNENVDVLTKDGVTSLELAVKYEVSSEVVKLLLQVGAQPVITKPTYESALIIASKQSSSLLPMLINKVLDSTLLDHVDSEGFAAIHYCCIHNNLEGVSMLLSAGAAVDLRDRKSGRTPLFHAIENNHVSIAQQLLHAGAITSIPNFAGQTLVPTINDVRNQPFRISLRKNVK